MQYLLYYLHHYCNVFISSSYCLSIQTHATHSVLMYYDEDDQWPAVYKSGKVSIQYGNLQAVCMHELRGF